MGEPRAEPAPRVPPQPRRERTREQTELLDKMKELDGQGAYSVITASLGKLHKNQYLAIPENVEIRPVPYHQVGTKYAAELYPYTELASVFMANKPRCSDPANAIMFAFLRMEAVLAGWVQANFEGQKEIIRTPRMNGTDALDDMLADLPNLLSHMPTVKTAAYLIPLVAEHVFRTVGHHFLTSETAVYLARYRQTLRACLVPEVADLAPPVILFHEALHWVTPLVARRVLEAQMGTGLLPEAIKIRASAAPAGTAIVTATAAVILAMRAQKTPQKMDLEFVRCGGFDLDCIVIMNEEIRRQPTRWHKAYFAYGLAPLNAAEQSRLDHAMKHAISFAPVAQAYNTVYLRDAALSQAKALAKHAQLNPVLSRRSERYFRELRRKGVSTI